MQTITEFRTTHLSESTVLSIGNFDGIHRGHRVLLQELQRVAEQMSGPSKLQTGIITFEPHPLTVLRPSMTHKLLTTPEERLFLSAELGIDIGIIQPFTTKFSQLSPRQFMTLLKDHLGMMALVVGPDFSVGRDRSGNLPVLRALGEELGYSVFIIEPVEWKGKSVRSSTIRLLLSKGDVAEAADLLGRCYHVSGIVEVGDRRGRQIGIPTANLHVPPEKLWPAYGVYATRTWLQDRTTALVYNSVTNIGTRPTVDGTQQRFETHLLDFPTAGDSDDLYGQTISVEFISRLRDENRFNNLDDLVMQIQIDIDQARQILPNPHHAAQPLLIGM